MVISGRRSRRDLTVRMVAWAAVMVTYLTLWSAGSGWMTYWWAWLFVLLPVCLSPVRLGGLRRPQPSLPQANLPQANLREWPADGFVPPRVRFPTSHRLRRRAVR